jgi:GT2 family glycosyltransferase
MNKSLAVLITCHNRREKTLSCLRALYDCQLPKNYSLDIFLVDDGSTDGTGTAVAEDFPAAHVIPGNGQLYWNRGMHLAWETASKHKEYNFYLWLNDDTLLFQEALTIMLNYSQIVENKRIIVGATCSKNGNPTYGGYIYREKRIQPNGEWQVCDYFNGNIVLVPRFIYNLLGNLENRFRHYLGDIDYGMRASKLGFKHILSPNYLGICEAHEADPIWRNPSYPFLKRLRHLYSPLGNNPIEFYYFDKRHNGLLIASFHFCTIHLRTFFPNLWKSVLPARS